MVLGGLVFSNFHFWRIWCLERTDFGEIPLWKDVLVL